MTDAEYHALAEAALARVESAIDALDEATDLDIDCRRTGKMIELVFADGSKIVINEQPPLHELWLAARSGGYHFRYSDGQWRSTRENAEFFALLSRCVSEHAQRSVTI